METDKLERQSITSLEELGRKAEKSLEITQHTIEERKREGKLKRDEDFLDHLNRIKTTLMWSFSIITIIFVASIIVVGLLPFQVETVGWKALESLFVHITENAKPVLLVILGFFFRGYLISNENSND